MNDLGDLSNNATVPPRVGSKELIMFCFSNRPIHGQHLQALTVGREWGSKSLRYFGSAACRGSFDRIGITGILWSLLSIRARCVWFFQSTHPFNLLFLLLARLCCIRSIYYLHEPTSLLEKINKGDGLCYSLAVAVSQRLETLLANRILVSCDAYRKRSNVDKIDILPLLVPDLPEQCGSVDSDRNQVILFGRANEMRCLTRFHELALLSRERALPYQFRILTYSHLPPAMEDMAISQGSSYTEDCLTTALNRSFAVWNVYSVPYSQSGVTPVALRAGVPLLVSCHELDDELIQAGVASCISLGDETLESCLEVLADYYENRSIYHLRCRDYFRSHHSPESGSSFLSELYL